MAGTNLVLSQRRYCINKALSLIPIQLQCPLCANSSRSSESKATTLAHGPQRILRSGVAAISAIMAPTWSIIRSTSPDGALGVHSSTALPVTTLCGCGTHIAEPDIAFDKLPRPQSGFAEAAAAGSFEPNDVAVS